MTELESRISKCRKVIAVEAVKDDRGESAPATGPVGSLLRACGWEYLGTHGGKAYFGLVAEAEKAAG